MGDRAVLGTLFSRYASDEGGATAIEYGLLLALMALALISGIGSLGEATGDSFQNTNDSIESA
ncbi:Flp family type IVb pilin [Hyphomonas johnsonii]|uniref:Flp family type IVb pilin n=1 Tax=Hyphomonas johnsonii TaxID=81031 RepID=UPI0005527136|nr:Flp family type IVb pilin [Hyphomonas johnsonii]